MQPRATPNQHLVAPERLSLTRSVTITARLTQPMQVLAIGRRCPGRSRMCIIRSEDGASRSRLSRAAYFLPLFLMPWLPVLRGPLPPALAASSLRAFSSVTVLALLYYCIRLVAAACLVRQVPLVITHRRASSRGKPCRPRRTPWPASWEP